MLTPVFWERTGNVPALTRLLEAYITKAGPDIAAANKLPQILGVFQKLNASKALDQYGFMILSSLVEVLPYSAYEQYMPSVWSLLFGRLMVRRVWCLPACVCSANFQAATCLCQHC